MTPNDVKIVADNIDDFIEVPDGVERLRKAVLALAVSGKLVPQDKKDGTAEDLYSKIQAERVKEEERQAGLKRKIKDVALIEQEEIPFKIPSSWKWVKLNQIGYTNIGLTYSPTDISDTGTPVLRSTNVQNGLLDLRELVRVKKLVKDSVLVQDGDLLVCARNGSKALVGKTAMIRNLQEPMAFGAFMAIYRSLYNPYVEIFLKSPIFRNLLDGVSTTTINQITQDNLKNTLLPLPPLSEQKRIVEKVAEVMKQLDVLEARKLARDEVRARLVRSVMDSLGKGEPKIAFEHLVELIRTPADLKELEGALLTLAVSGQLVPQKKSEGIAEDLYTEIQKRRADRVEGRKKKVKDFAPITQEVIPFEIPRSWKWARMSKLVDLITDGEHISPGKHAAGIPLVTAKNVVEAGVTFQNVDYVTKEDAKKFWARCHPEKGDLLICSRGTIGRTTIVNIEEPFCLMGSVILIKFYDSTTSDYCKYYLRTQSGVSQIGLMRKGMAVGALYLKDIEKALIPLPPLAEQKRIVKKVEEVMSLVNKLKPLVAVEK